MASQENDWIEWTGGVRPVPLGTSVQVRFRDGGQTQCAYAAEDLIWSHGVWASADAHITAYRVVSS